MLDGAEHGRAIADHPDDVEAALEAYEASRFPCRGAEAAAAHETVELIFGADAPHALARLFNGR